MPRIEVRVQPNGKTEKVDQVSPISLKVKTRAPALEGKANERVIELLADFFGVRKSAVSLARGEKSKNKLFSISE